MLPIKGLGVEEFLFFMFLYLEQCHLNEWPIWKNKVSSWDQSALIFHVIYILVYIKRQIEAPK